MRACLALRDAFTNKQRLRRLRALAKRRAEEQASNNDDDNRSTMNGGVVDTADEEAAGGLATGQENGDGEGRGEVEVDSEVVAAAAGLAAMSVGRSSALAAEHGSEAAGGETGAGERVDGSTAEETPDEASGGRDSRVGCDTVTTAVAAAGGGDCLAAKIGGNHAGGLLIEGRAVPTAGGGSTTPTPMKAAPCAGGVLERVEEEEEGLQQQQPQRVGEEDDEDEAPLCGIWRCEGHLRAAAAALESLLAIEASLEGNLETPLPLPPPPPPPPTRTTDAAARNRLETDKGTEAAGGAAATTAAAAANGGCRKDGEDKGEGGFRLGGTAGAFAFEAEMNRHLLGSSPQHHVHFRRGRADGPRKMMLLARQAERACRVVRCEDLLDARRCLVRLFQPPPEV